MLGWFVGQVMKDRRQGQPKVVNETFKDFSAELVPLADGSVFDKAAIAEFRAKWRRKSNKAEIDGWEDVQLLKEAGLTVDGLPTFAGLILLGTEAAMIKHLANAEVIFEYRNSKSSIQSQERKEFRRGFFAWADKAWDLVSRKNEQHSVRLRFERYPIYAFDEDSVREAILNAVAHRDYREEGSISIKQFPDRLQVESPGGLPQALL